MKIIVASVVISTMLIGILNAQEEHAQGLLLSVGKAYDFEIESSAEDKRVCANETIDTVDTALNIGYGITKNVSLSLTNDIALHGYDKVVEVQNIGLTTGAFRLSMHYKWD